MNDIQQYAHRNGETIPPELTKDEFSWYWFDGIAHYEDWQQRGKLTVVTGKHTNRVAGLVVVAMMLNMKHPKTTATGDYVRDHAVMIAEPETNGYDLDKCEGRWWGPVSVPHLSDDILISAAMVEDYEEWKKFYP